MLQKKYFLQRLIQSLMSALWSLLWQWGPDSACYDSHVNIFCIGVCPLHVEQLHNYESTLPSRRRVSVKLGQSELKHSIWCEHVSWATPIKTPTGGMQWGPNHSPCFLWLQGSTTSSCETNCKDCHPSTLTDVLFAPLRRYSHSLFQVKHRRQSITTTKLSLPHSYLRARLSAWCPI